MSSICREWGCVHQLLSESFVTHFNADSAFVDSSCSLHMLLRFVENQEPELRRVDLSHPQVGCVSLL